MLADSIPPLFTHLKVGCLVEGSCWALSWLKLGVGDLSCPQTWEFWWMFRNPVLSRVTWLSGDCSSALRANASSPSSKTAWLSCLGLHCFSSRLGSPLADGHSASRTRQGQTAAVTLVQLQPARDVLPASVPAGGWAREAALLAERVAGE